jgi:hypothetical protein
MGRQATEAERQPPDRVGSARLTCGQPSDQPASAQVSPKREDLTTSTSSPQPDYQAKRELWLRLAEVVK